MTTADAQRYLKGLALKFKLARVTEIKLGALGLGLLTFSLVRLVIVSIPVAIGAGVIMFVVVIIVRILRTGALRWNSLKVSLFLNRSFPLLEESADLLVSSKPLSTLEEVQRQYVLTTLDSVKGRVSVPHRIGQGVVILAVGMAAFLLLPSASLKPVGGIQAVETAKDTVPTSPELAIVSITITPPTYTRIKPYTSVDPNVQAPASSQVIWNITFRGNALTPRIIISGQDTIALKREKNMFSTSRSLRQRVFYQIAWKDDQGKLYTSDYFQVGIREDAPPVVEIVGRDQFQEVRPGDALQMEVRVRISDDYRVANAHLIATVSKGSGESVKFREEKLLFENTSGLPGKQVELTRQIDLQKLGLEPGDELYFYAEAIDNKAPVPNLSRTETFFITLQDTVNAVTVADSGLGVDLMPEYFRSQRQIIIDTEKLLAEQRRIKKQQFNARSNELGYDQKALRLRYGQFLGMEDEAGIGAEAGLPVREAMAKAAEEDASDPMKQFGHQHDTKNEHNLVDEKNGVKIDLEHDHVAKSGEEGKDEDPMKAFLHEHDSQDEAAFFVQSVKAKLKAALTLMWDSELQLRMYEPKKSLPTQYKILALLKEIAQDSRVYVHRSGFDPPPIKEERRLTGELDEVANITEISRSTRADLYPAIQAALAHVELLLQEPTPTISEGTRILASSAGYEVAVEELKQPGRFLQTLSDLRKLADGKVEQGKLIPALLSIRKAFWSILPVETYSPNRARRTLHPLDKVLLENLEMESHE